MKRVPPFRVSTKKELMDELSEIKEQMNRCCVSVYYAMVSPSVYKMSGVMHIDPFVTLRNGNRLHITEAEHLADGYVEVVHGEPSSR